MEGRDVRSLGDRQAILTEPVPRSWPAVISTGCRSLSPRTPSKWKDQAGHLHPPVGPRLSRDFTVGRDLQRELETRSCSLYSSGRDLCLYHITVHRRPYRLYLYKGYIPSIKTIFLAASIFIISDMGKLQVIFVRRRSNNICCCKTAIQTPAKVT